MLFMTQHSARTATLIGSVVLIGTLQAAQAQTRVDLSSGANYSSGDFGGTENTSVLILPFSAKVTKGNWSFRASVPYVSISGPENVSVVVEDDNGRASNSGSGSSGGAGSGSASGSRGSSGGNGSGSGGNGPGQGGSTPPAGTPVRDRTLSGIGDTSLSATYSFNSIAGSPAYLDLIGRVRLPTGDETKGTGTGATDYIVQTELGVDMDSGGAYISGGRRMLGQSAGVQRVDGWQAGAGVWANVGRSTVLGLYYDWRDASTPTGENPRELGVYTIIRVTRAWKLELDAGGTMSDTGPDYTAGLTVYWRAFDSRRR
jgi:hypothetical protein